MAARDERFMALALTLAQEASRAGDVPVGAVLVRRGEMVGWGFNRRHVSACPTGHAEVMAINMAARNVGEWRLTQSTLYVTLEPCMMCAGVINQARITRLVFGCRDPKQGAVRSLFALVDDPRLTHRVEVSEGILATSCQDLLTSFFHNLRQSKS